MNRRHDTCASLLEDAHALILNVGTPEWYDNARNWLDAYHDWMAEQSLVVEPD